MKKLRGPIVALLLTVAFLGLAAITAASKPVRDARLRAYASDTRLRSELMADPGFQHQSFVSIPAPATGGVDSVLVFNADLIPFMKNDGAVDVLVAFDNNGKLAATTLAGTFTLKATESWTYVPIRTGHVALHSTGAASAVRIAGVW